MTSRDPDLKRLLDRWPAPRPGPGFRAAVWRRIRADGGRLPWPERLLAWLDPLRDSRPVFATVCLLTLVLWAAALALPSPGGGRDPLASLSGPAGATLASAYGKLLTGGGR